MSQLRYPEQLQVNKETDYIRFQFFKYKPPFKRGGVGATGYYQTSEGNVGEQTGSEILMFMPQDVSTSMSTSFGGKEITNMAAGTLAAYSNLQNLNIDGVVGNLQAGVAGAGALPSTVGAELVRAGLEATGLQENLSINDILGGTAGTILNPNVELLFGGPSLRNIGFRFKMAARSEKEAKSMIRICRAFQHHASASFGGEGMLSKEISQVFSGVATAVAGSEQEEEPELGLSRKEIVDNISNSSNFISVPDLCVFKYMTGNDPNKYINQYKACAITNVDVNFTPDGSYSTLIGGYPSALELSIALVETKIIYRSEVKTGLGVSN